MAEGNYKHALDLINELFENRVTRDRRHEPDEQRIFQKMIDPPYKGRVLFSHLVKMSPEDFSPETLNYTTHILWFRRHDDNFAIYEGDSGRVAMYGVRVKNAKLCMAYNSQQLDCSDDECRYFHLCQKFLGGDCIGSRCTFDHHFQSKHNRQLLKRYDLEKYNDDDLQTIFRQSQAQVCNFYARKGTCDNEDRCTRIHVCADFVRGICSNDEADCPKKLKHSFDTPHSIRLLRIYDLHDRQIQEILKQLLVVSYPGQRNKNKVDDEEFLKRLEALLTLTDKAEDEEENKRESRSAVTGELKEKRKSKTALPKKITRTGNAFYQWQIEIFGSWISFDSKHNKKLEEDFCNPAKETVNITLPDVDEYFLEDDLISVHFDSMLATLTTGQENLQIQRQQNQQDLWFWYYQMDDKSWVLFPEDDQVILETGFAIKEKRVYVGKKQRYRIKFSDLTQKNRETGKERKIRRRPIFTDE